MKKLILLTTFLGLVFSSNLSFENIPIQEEGRIKPLDTFAKNQLLRIYGKRTISDSKITSTDWLFGVLISDSKILSIPVFYIINPEVIHALELEMKDGRKYTFKEISEAIQSNIEMLEKIHKKHKEEENLSLVEKQLLEIYFNAIHFKILQSDFSCLTPLIPIQDPNIAKRLDVKKGEKVSFFKISRNLNKMEDLVDSIDSKKIENWNASDSSFYKIIQVLKTMNDNNLKSNIMKIIPPMNGHHNNEWMSPWEVISFGKLKDSYYNDLLISLESYIMAYNNDSILSNQSIENYEVALYKMSSQIPSISELNRETWYNKANLFTNSIVFYILTFIVICMSLLFWPNILQKFAYICLLIGFGFHTYGLLMRMLIMERPPVTTLYESIIFVSFISVLLSIIIEYFRKDGLGILAAALSGIIFHYIAFGYASDGDTLGVLVAVLNSNFWLATHVTTITIGYGTSIVAGIMGHIYLLYLIIYPNDKKKLKSIYSNTFGITLLALFFTLFGTILGGIWADQSWGRFWGWDPKENGALLICMWQIFMIHLRLTGSVKGLGFSIGMIINNIIVAMAWFGVNLLSIGLHSYGFVSGIATNLMIFTIFELTIALGGYCYVRLRKL